MCFLGVVVAIPQTGKQILHSHPQAVILGTAIYFGKRNVETVFANLGRVYDIYIFITKIFVTWTRLQ